MTINRTLETMMDDYKRHYEGKTVLITGGAGAIGSNLACAIANLNAREVIVFDDLKGGMSQTSNKCFLFRTHMRQETRISWKI